MIHTQSHVQSRKMLWPALTLLVLPLFACPPPPKPRPRPRDDTPAAYPYRGKTIRLDGRVHVFDRSKTRAIGVQFKAVAGGLQKPVAVVGIDTRRGETRWTKTLPLKLRNPNLPWSFEIARNVTYVAAWIEGGRIRAFDIYGRDAWTAKLENTRGVTALGEGFVTAKGSKIYFLDRASGKANIVADLGAPITAPLAAHAEGVLFALTADFLVGVDLDKRGDNKVMFRKRLRLEEGLKPTKPVISADTVLVGTRAVPIVIKTEVSRLDPRTLKPRWRRLLPGRVRSHESLRADAREIRVVNRVPGKPDALYRLNANNGEIMGQTVAQVRRGCVLGKKQLFCITKNAMTAYNRNNLSKVWSREMFDDYTANRHLPHGDEIYIAEGHKVVRVNDTGRVTFTFELKAPPYRPQVNRILGVVGDTLVIVVADWVRLAGTGQVWGVNLTTGKRRWVKRLVAPAYAERSVQLMGDRVFWADGLFVNACKADTGRALGRWPHLIRAPKTRVPTVSAAHGQVWMTRVGKLALLSPKNGRVWWKAAVDQKAAVVAVGKTLLFVKKKDGAIQALDLKSGKPRWTAPFAVTLTPRIVEVEGGVILSHHKRMVVLDPATGKQKTETKPGGWQLQMLGDTPLLVRVLTFRPRASGSLEAFRYLKERKKAEVGWLFKVPKAEAAATPLPTAVPGAFPWFHAAGDLVVLPRKGGRCLWALDLYEGTVRWKTCSGIWVAPPRAYRDKLYMATGPYLSSVPEEQQGLFAIASGNGQAKRLFKIPRHGNERFMWPQYGPVRQGEFFVLTQDNRLRQLFLAAPLKRR